MPDAIHIVCARCNAVVRVPRDRLQEPAKCPKCQSALFTGKPIALTTAAFDQHVSRNDLPVIVDFWAPWCGPCRMMEPHYERVALQLERQARFAKVNSDNEPQLSARFHIRGIPTLIAFKNGREVARQSGAMDANGLTRWLQSSGAITG
jgi:thioredoxin 2